MRLFKIVAIKLFVFAFCIVIATESIAAPTDLAKPNILIIVGDDMGFADVGFQGCKDIPTPALNQLAADGVRFTNGYVTGPYCSPTRAGLLTGRHQARFGHEFNPSGGREGLPVSEVTIADRLKKAGYRTGLVGKWHLGSSAEMHPQKRGFDEFYGFLGGAHSFFEPQGILNGNENVKDMDYTTDAFGREAVAFIDRNKSQPWMLYLSFNAVHTPMHATPDRLAKFANIKDKQRQTYAAMMLAMDEAVGKVREKLTETGQDKNTIVFFISDNGGPTMPGVTVNGSDNAPFRGSKRTTLEGGIRVPFLIAWPGKLKPAINEHLVVQLDIHATALAAAGVNSMPEWKLDGVNLLPYVNEENKGAPHDALFWRFGDQMAIRKGNWKLVRYDRNADTLTGKTGQGVTNYKLFNLDSDVHEDMDLAAIEPAKVKELQEIWANWNLSNVAPIWGKGSEQRTDQNKGKSKAKRK